MIDHTIEEDAIVVTDENFGALLIESARQALAIERGEMEPARVRRYPHMASDGRDLLRDDEDGEHCQSQSLIRTEIE